MVTKPVWLWKVVQLLRFTVKPIVKHNTLWAHSSADKEPKLFREGRAEVFISPLGVSEGEGVSERGGGTGESFWVGSGGAGKSERGEFFWGILTNPREGSRRPSWRRGSRQQAMCRPRAWGWPPPSTRKNLNLRILNLHWPLRLLTDNKYIEPKLMKFITNSLTIHDSVVMVVILCCLGLKPPSPCSPAQLHLIITPLAGCPETTWLLWIRWGAEPQDGCPQVPRFSRVENAIEPEK